MGNILQILEQASYATVSNGNSSLVNTVIKNHFKISKMVVTC